MDREVELRGVVDELLLPATHRLAAPAGDCILVDGLALVGDHEVLVDADDLSVPFAAGAGAERVVEAEQMLGRGFELDAVGLEARREGAQSVVGDRLADAPAVGEGAGYGVADAGRDLLVVVHAQTVDDDAQLVGLRVGSDSGQDVFDEPHLAAGVDAHETLGEQQRQLFDDPLPFGE